MRSGPRGRCTIARMKLARLMVSDHMTPNPITIEPDGRAIGILTDNDLTRALVDVMREAKAAAG